MSTPIKNVGHFPYVNISSDNCLSDLAVIFPHSLTPERSTDRWSGL